MKLQTIKFFVLILIILLEQNCVFLDKKQTLIGRNPIPYPASSLILFNRFATNGNQFRNPSIHFSESARALQGDFSSGWISIPNSNVFGKSIAELDKGRYELVKLKIVSNGCQKSLKLPRVLRNNDLTFSVSQQGFFTNAIKILESEKIEYLFDTRLDLQKTYYLLGIYTTTCFEISALGARLLSTVNRQ